MKLINNALIRIAIMSPNLDPLEVSNQTIVTIIVECLVWRSKGADETNRGRDCNPCPDGQIFSCRWLRSGLEAAAAAGRAVASRAIIAADARAEILNRAGPVAACRHIMQGGQATVGQGVRGAAAARIVLEGVHTRDQRSREA